MLVCFSAVVEISDTHFDVCIVRFFVGRLSLFANTAAHRFVSARSDTKRSMRCCDAPTYCAVPLPHDVVSCAKKSTTNF